MFPTWNMEHGCILSMPDLNFILIFDQNDVFDHFLIFTPFLRLIFAIYLETLLRSYITKHVNVQQHATRVLSLLKTLF